MKLLPLVMLTIIALSGCGRLTRVPESDRMVRQVFTVQLSQDELFERALEWCAKKFVSINDAVVVKNKEKGKIIARGTGKYSEYFDFLVDREFSYNVTIEIKDGRYRVTFDNFIVYYDERQLKSSPATYQFEITKMRKTLDKLMEDLRDYIARGSTEKKGEKKQEEEW